MLIPIIKMLGLSNILLNDYRMILQKSINASLRTYLSYRFSRIESIRNNPYELQKSILAQLIDNGKTTKYGQLYNFKHVQDYKSFSTICPLSSYNEIKPFIFEAMEGTRNVLWPGETNFFSKSSGTTQENSKFLPVTKDLLYQNLRSGGWDATSMMYHHRPSSDLPARKNLLMGGSLKKWHRNANCYVGDVSAIMISQLPRFSKKWYAPDFEIALMETFERKLELMSRALVDEDLFILAGVPTWTVVLFEKMLALTGKEHMLEIWPNAKVYFHGGVGFDPYRKQFEDYLPSDDFDFYEVYNASEGYFGFQDLPEEDEMLLLFGNGIFYEFIPSESINDDEPVVIGLEDVEIGKNYEMVISTVGGLWRYRLGDTIRFSSILPYRFKLTGRPKQFINGFGEEVMISDTDKAIAQVCQKLDANVRDYTVAPIYMEKANRGGHEWVIEFAKEPQDINQFQNLLDLSLQQINSDYQAKRYKDLALKNLEIRSVPNGSFDNWLKAKGKMGSQNKVPRLSCERKYIDEIKAMSRVD